MKVHNKTLHNCKVVCHCPMSGSVLVFSKACGGFTCKNCNAPFSYESLGNFRAAAKEGK